MTVSSQTSRETYNGNGVTTTWDLPFRFFSNTDIYVFLIDPALGTSTPLILGGDYTLTGAGLPEQFGVAPGKIITTTPVATGKQLYVERLMEVEQQTDIVNQGRFFPDVHEDVFDRLTMLIQQAIASFGRALVRPVGKDYYDAENHQIKNLADGGDNQDAVNIRTMRGYVDTSIAGVVGGFGNFIQSGMWAIVRTFQDKMRESVSVLDFGAVGNGIFDNTSAINAANNAATGMGKKLFFPAGTYLCGQIPALQKQYWYGEGPNTTIIKAKNSLNADFFTSGASASADEVTVRDIRFDGNRSNNTTGHSFKLKGARQVVKNVIIINAAENGMITDYDVTTALRATGFEGIIEDVLIDTCGKSGWVFNGSNDTSLKNITIIDAGLSADNTYYGAIFNTSCRVNNIHPWNRSNVVVTPSAGVYVNAGGCTFVNSHFEGGHTPLKILTNGNTFESCGYYATRGAYCIENYGTGNRITGAMGLGAYAGNPNYVGIFNNGSCNQIELTDVGCINGAIEFAGGGNNFIRITGFRATGQLKVGNPSITDDVLINVSGAGGGILRQRLSIAPTATVQPLTSAGGALSNATATVDILKDGKYVDWGVLVSIVAIGAAGTDLQVTMPFTSTRSRAAFGYETLTGNAVRMSMNAGTNVLRIVSLTNGFVGANGMVINGNGRFEFT